ncbi:MAG: nuclear transport factor 2 family protein [Gemmatimonadaceae bacterium]
MPLVTATEGRDVIDRLVRAINRHDVEAIGELCHPGIRGELPAHPARNYVGVEMLRANWALIFELVPDLSAELTRCGVDGDLVWAEWAWTGTQTDGSRFERTGVAIHGLRDGRIEWVRLHMQPILSRPVTAVDVALRDLGRRPPDASA